MLLQFSHYLLLIHQVLFEYLLIVLFVFELTALISSTFETDFVSKEIKIMSFGLFTETNESRNEDFVIAEFKENLDYSLEINPNNINNYT